MFAQRRSLKRKPGSKLLLRESLASGLFLAPSLVGLLFFYVLPFALIVFYSFVENPISLEFAGFEKYRDLFENSSFWLAIGNTAFFSAVAVPLGMVLSLLLAVALDQAIPGKSRFRTVLFSPMMVPVASVVLVWQIFFHQGGLVNTLIPAFSGLDWLKSSHAQAAILSLYLWKNTGYFMVLFLAALGNLPQDLIESAKLDGAGAFTVFFRVKLRYLSPTILFVAVLGLIQSFKVFREIYLLAGDYPYSSLYLTQHFMNNLFKNLDYPHISASAILMLLCICALIALLFFLEDSFGKDVEQ